MNLDEIRPLVGGDGGVDVTSTYQAFCREHGKEDLAGFLLWLQKKKMLSPEGERRARVARLAFSNPAPDESTRTSAGVAAPATDPAADRMVSVDADSFRPDAQQARYSIIGTLGEGGMGQVLVARDNDLRRKVAVKTLRPQLVGEPKIVGRFLGEAQITAQLDHPNVIPVYGLEVDSRGAISYTMKMIRGKTLKDVIDETTALLQSRRPLDEEHSLAGRLDVFLKVCDAIHYAHSKGVIHRDLKPPNIMVGKYREVYVMDWGIARLMDGSEEAEREERVDVARPVVPVADGGPGVDLELTRVGQAIGTPRFMSPEQAAGRNRELDGRSDQYALGLILFELVSLRRGVEGDDPLSTLKNSLAGNTAPLVHLTGERIPRELRAIIARATRLLREQRYPSVAAMAEDVRRYLRGEAVLARPDNPLQKLLRWIGRHREWTLVAILLLLLGSALQMGWAERRRKEAEERAFERERRLRTLLTQVSKQAHRIDTRFLELEESLEGLAQLATWSLSRGAEGEDPVYLLEDFQSPDRRPSDYGWCPVYRWPVSLDHAVAVLRPGLSAVQMMPKLRRLAPLRHHYRRMFRESSPFGREPLSPTQERILLGEKGVGLDFAYVVLPEGVIYLYPGEGSFPPDYDPRGSAYYRLSAEKHGKFWGSPYVDSSDSESGDELVLPCTTSLWDVNGTFLGVAGVELTFDRIIEQLLAIQDVPGVLETTLVDETGRVLVDSGDKGKRFKSAGNDIGVNLEPYPVPAVVNAIRNRQAGILEGTRDGRAMILVAYRLEMKGWYYVVEVDAGEFLKPR